MVCKVFLLFYIYWENAKNYFWTWNMIWITCLIIPRLVLCSYILLIYFHIYKEPILTTMSRKLAHPLFPWHCSKYRLLIHIAIEMDSGNASRKTRFSMVFHLCVYRMTKPDKKQHYLFYGQCLKQFHNNFRLNSPLKIAETKSTAESWISLAFIASKVTIPVHIFASIVLTITLILCQQD